MVVSNIAASVRQKLLNRAKQQGDDFQLLLVRYANERLLYRLSQSQYKDRFILKGATLFSVWSNTPHRATRDVDLLGRGAITEPFLMQAFADMSEMVWKTGSPSTPGRFRSRLFAMTRNTEVSAYGCSANSATRVCRFRST